MKKLFTLLLLFALSLSLFSCSEAYSSAADYDYSPPASSISPSEPLETAVPESPSPTAPAESSDPYADLWVDETESAIPSPSLVATKTVSPTPTIKPTPEPAPTLAPTVPPVSEENEIMVWISGKGKKYHSNPDCSNMKNPSQVTISEAESRGRGPCKKCY